MEVIFMKDEGENKRKTVFQCTFEGCNKVFGTSYKLTCHNRIHSGERPFTCLVGDCTKSYTRAWHLDRHTKNEHLPKKVAQKFKCTYDGCSMELSSMPSLTRHIDRAHNNVAGIIKCSTCHKKFKSEEDLKFHKYRHTDKKPFKCQIEGCLKAFPTAKRLSIHNRLHEGYPCDIEGCLLIFPNFSQLRSHKAKQHPPDFSCPVCKKKLPTQFKLKLHKYTHSKKRNVYICPKPGCKRYYFKKSGLKLHISSFHDNVFYKCTHKRCRKRFSHKGALTMHLKRHENPVPFKPRKGSKRRSKAAKFAGYKAPFTEEKPILEGKCAKKLDEQLENSEKVPDFNPDDVIIESIAEVYCNSNTESDYSDSDEITLD